MLWASSSFAPWFIPAGFCEVECPRRRPDDRQATHLCRGHVNLIGALTHIAKEAFDGIVSFQIHSQGGQNDSSISFFPMMNAEMHSIQIRNSPVFLQAVLTPGFTSPGRAS
jgi:hypothetical protein